MEKYAKLGGAAIRAGLERLQKRGEGRGVGAAAVHCAWMLQRVLVAMSAPLVVALSATAASDEGRRVGRVPWQFVFQSHVEDTEYRTRKIRAIDAWWGAFRAKTGDLDAYFNGSKKWDLGQWMEDHLQAIDERIMWEFGPGLHGGHRLVITPEVNRELRPLVDTILERAPALQGWEFYGYRLAESVAQAERMLEARGLISLAKAHALVALGKHNRVDLTFYSPDFKGSKDQDALNAAFVATEVLLGEQVLDTWVGAVSVEKSTELAPGVIALADVRETVDGYVSRLKADLPDKPAWQLPEDTHWTMWELKPQKSENYPQQLDLFVGKSMYPDMWVAAHSGVIFHSERFSKHGELFCYVKIDGSVDLTGEKFQDKAQIEDAIDASLKEAKAGAVVGGGTGLRYSYIDLALADPEKGIRHVINVLREGNISKPAWILFFDDIYSYEWIGVWDDSPAPPGIAARDGP